MGEPVRILAVIPARGGSKRLPGKNIKQLGGKPLIAHSILALNAVKHLFSDTIVSTDDKRIADVAEQYGGKVPFIRPACLATDMAKSSAVLKHAVYYYEEQHAKKLDWVLLLQPTNPLVKPTDIEQAVKLAMTGEYDSIVSVCNITDHHHPRKAKILENGFLKPFLPGWDDEFQRQTLSAVFQRNGSIYMSKRSLIIEHDTLYGDRIGALEMPQEQFIDIDTPVDFCIAEALLRYNNDLY